MNPGLVVENVLKVIEEIYTERRLGKIEVHWLTDQQLLELNIKHLNHDYLTDIITQMVQGNAAEHGCSELTETQRVVAHGILHLLGFGDKSAEEAAIMRTKENEVLARL
jgi:probable rRNA maturation factor